MDEVTLSPFDPSIRPNARRLPPVSTTAMHIGCPMRVALAIALFNTLSAPSGVSVLVSFVGHGRSWNNPLERLPAKAHAAPTSAAPPPRQPTRDSPTGIEPIAAMGRFTCGRPA